MDQVHVIRHKVLVEGQGIRRVAREMRVSRNTVRRYLGEPEPRRRELRPRGRPVWVRVVERVKRLLEEWSGRTTANQRITGTRVHRHLVEEGLDVGVITVRRVLWELRRQQAEVYIPLVHRPGEEAQVDFFQVTVEEHGVQREVWKLVVHLMYSGRDLKSPVRKGVRVRFPPPAQGRQWLVDRHTPPSGWWLVLPPARG